MVHIPYPYTPVLFFEKERNWLHYASNWCQLSTWSQPGVWNWIHYASNWCQLSTWSQPSVWNWIDYASNWFQLSTWSQPGVWNWIHYASNWCQLSTWSQPSVEIEMHYKANLFQYDQQSKTNFISQAPTSTVNRWLKVAKVSIWKAGTWTSPSPSPCWKACSSSPWNGSSPHGKFKPATDKNRKNILWSSPPNNQTYIVHTTPLVNILQNVGPNELSIVPGPRQSQEITTL